MLPLLHHLTSWVPSLVLHLQYLQVRQNKNKHNMCHLLSITQSSYVKICHQITILDWLKFWKITTIGLIFGRNCPFDLSKSTMQFMPSSHALAHLVFLWGALGSCLKGPASLMLSNAPLGDSSQLKSWKRGFGKILHQRWKISYWLQPARSNQYSKGVKIVTIANHIISRKGFSTKECLKLISYIIFL